MDPKFALCILLVLLLTSPLFITNTMKTEAVQPYEKTNQREPYNQWWFDILIEAINPNTTLTFFCLNSMYSQPPLTLLKYHVVPFKVDKDSMEAFFRHVAEWDLYNNGRLIVHEVEDFFDPIFQTLSYPEYDVVTKDDVSYRLAAASTCVVILVFFFCAKPSKMDDVHYSPFYHRADIN
ncbi:unnamed protein product [Malus baccata var. baccata]